MSYIVDQIKETMSINGVDRCTIIVNGLYWIHRGDMVNVRLELDDNGRDSRLRFFTGTLKEPKYLDEAETKLQKQLEMKIDLTGLEFIYDPDYVECAVVQGESIILLKSSVYSLMERALTLESDQALLVGNHRTLTDVEITRLKNMALKWLYTAFGETMYKHYKPITSFARYNKFYKLFRLYVPVIIVSNFMYNPLLFEPRFLNSQLYQMAIQKNRKITTPTGMQCYFLTELEVCKALHLKNFTRFTPSLFYRVLVGSLRADIPGFPRVARSDMDVRYVRDAGIYQDGFRNEYTLEQYANLVQQYQDSTMDLENLKMFRRVDSLFTACAHEARILRKYGGYALDNEPVSTGALYRILQEARV